VTHLHVVDGVLPWWIVGLSLLLSALLVAGTLAGRGERERIRFLARTGVMAAALIVTMSLPIGPGVHLSLAPLAGMMLGPRGGFLAAFLANASLALLGHGGLTALGVNGLFLGTQAAAGGLLFALLRRPLGVRAGAVVSTAAVLGSAAMVALAALRALPLDGSGHEGHHHGPEEAEWGAWLVAVLAAAAAILESVITASVVEFLARVRTDLVHGGGAPRPRTSGEPA
jgi:cobalt/nickel transport system permease protein